jgi:Uma2 family endonuclease
MNNEPQPDAFLMIDPSRGGQAQVDSDGYVTNAPELVAEVAASNASYDLHTKLTVYRRNRIREYIVWRVLDQEIDWFVLRGSNLDRLVPDSAGIVCSECFPGLWLDVSALIRDDLPTVLKVVQQGLATPEHADFCR